MELVLLRSMHSERRKETLIHPAQCTDDVWHLDARDGAARDEHDAEAAIVMLWPVLGRDERSARFPRLGRTRGGVGVGGDGLHGR